MNRGSTRSLATPAASRRIRPTWAAWRTTANRAAMLRNEPGASASSMNHRDPRQILFMSVIHAAAADPDVKRSADLAAARADVTARLDDAHRAREPNWLGPALDPHGSRAKRGQPLGHDSPRGRRAVGGGDPE